MARRIPLSPSLSASLHAHHFSFAKGSLPPLPNPPKDGLRLPRVLPEALSRPLLLPQSLPLSETTLPALLRVPETLLPLPPPQAPTAPSSKPSSPVSKDTDSLGQLWKVVVKE